VRAGQAVENANVETEEAWRVRPTAVRPKAVMKKLRKAWLGGRPNPNKSRMKIGIRL